MIDDIMIRDYRNEDRCRIVEILNNGLSMDMSYINNDLLDDKSKKIVYDDGEIKGYILLTPRNQITKFWNIDIYVNPRDRKKGIGTKLYEKASKFLREEMVNTLSTKYVEDKSKAYEFYKKLDFKRWFSYYEMVHQGDSIVDSKLTFINYEDKYYNKYVELIAEGFYSLRVTNDIQPYICYTPSEEDRKNIIGDKDNIFISIDSEDEIIASVFIKDGYIDELVVNKKYRGVGLGKEVTRFAIQKCISLGVDNISLDVITTNETAIAIYKELGFNIVQKINIARQFLEKEPW